MAFVNGIELSRRFHAEWIEPLLFGRWPLLRYASALIGPGSEVLGFDTEMSTDHDWGPRVCLFVQERDESLTDEIARALRAGLPDRFRGYPVDPNQSVVTTLRQYAGERLAVDIRQELQLVDWLAFPSQTLAELTGGAVFRDDTGELTALRHRLHAYPHDVWLYLMASTWQRIGQEEHLTLRSGYVGDELGSSLIASRIVADMMNLCFLMERRYAPYPKWFGTAFKGIEAADELLPLLTEVQSAHAWRAREAALSQAYACVARLHNRLGITAAMPEETAAFYDRPFQVIRGETFARAIAGAIADPVMRKLSERRLIGGIDQITDNTDFRAIHQGTWREGASRRNAIRILYDELLR
ncbi:DUF4037 domain-containing protein [Cohnella nanjingensis]|uniref:DUF4037 domain-containing protein n=1 Tax=Cohnella nanjingensis TaxID=1387779 RepID=A0A7X0VGV6_9BACL|nr:DUF4037 domain-containing protein [Cohnella nanjingensis]MBB6672024.1 DUF4037 domain-containing protein [Cohnella nanjingensis]